MSAERGEEEQRHEGRRLPHVDEDGGVHRVARRAQPVDVEQPANARVMRPYSGLKSHAQIAPRPRRGWPRARAPPRAAARGRAPARRAGARSARPSASSSTTETTAKYAVLPSAVQKRASWRRKRVVGEADEAPLVEDHDEALQAEPGGRHDGDERDREEQRRGGRREQVPAEPLAPARDRPCADAGARRLRGRGLCARAHEPSRRRCVTARLRAARAPPRASGRR